MSAIATFVLIPASALGDLREAAIPKKSFFGDVRDRFSDFLAKHGSEVAQYSWSGYVLATVLPYLESEKKIILMKPDFEGLGEFLSKVRGSTVFVFSAAQKVAALNELSNQSFSADEMRDYFNKFNASNEKDIGGAMLDGIEAIRASLEHIDANSVVLLMIG